MNEKSRPASPAGNRASNPFWTIANGLSLLRAALTGPVLWMIWMGPAYKWYLFSVVMAMIITDILDGYLARRRGTVTRWGKILDPLADKVAIDAIAIVLAIVKGLPLWVVAVAVGRDVAIVAAGVFLLNRDRIVLSSNVWGKLTSCAMSVLLIAYAMDAQPLKVPFLYLSALLLLVSSASYARIYLKQRR
ncbi:MAG: CDP-alcohol phosphatidyltransferase family protein [Gemmatimonadota bacterium]|nr:CDP-alcohol phosphatidyltransferase family protein [Gemmatimonadota bacterium]